MMSPYWKLYYTLRSILYEIQYVLASGEDTDYREFLRRIAKRIVDATDRKTPTEGAQNHQPINLSTASLNALESAKTKQN